MYQVETVSLSKMSVITKHDLQIPIINNNTQFSLKINESLEENELYSMNIITVNHNGEANSTGNIQFSK